MASNRAWTAGSASSSSMGRGSRQLQLWPPTVPGVLMRSGRPSSSWARVRARLEARAVEIAQQGQRARALVGRQGGTPARAASCSRSASGSSSHHDTMGAVSCVLHETMLVARERLRIAEAPVLVLLPGQHAVARQAELAQHLAHERRDDAEVLGQRARRLTPVAVPSSSSMAPSTRRPRAPCASPPSGSKRPAACRAAPWVLHPLAEEADDVVEAEAIVELSGVARCARGSTRDRRPPSPASRTAGRPQSCPSAEYASGGAPSDS